MHVTCPAYSTKHYSVNLDFEVFDLMDDQPNLQILVLFDLHDNEGV